LPRARPRIVRPANAGIHAVRPFTSWLTKLVIPANAGKSAR
jgi:hypothetical protein